MAIFLESLACGLLGDCFLQMDFILLVIYQNHKTGVHGVCTARDEMEERNIKAIRKDCLNLSLFKEPMKSKLGTLPKMNSIPF